MKKLQLLLVCGSVLLAGCPLRVETNEQACERLFDHFLDCVPEDGVDPTPFIEQLCNEVPPDDECNFPALTDCLIENVPCDAVLGGGQLPASCEELAADCSPELP